MTAAWDRDEALRVAGGLEARFERQAAALLRAADAEIAQLRAREEAAEKMAEALRGVIEFDRWASSEGGVTPPHLIGCWDRACAALAAWDASRGEEQP